MTGLTFDKSKLLPLYFRIGEDGEPMTITFLNDDGSSHAIDGEDFSLICKANPGATANIFEMTIGVELAVAGADLNQLVISPVASNTLGKRPGTNFWYLYSNNEGRTWLNGPAKFHNGDFDGVTTEDMCLTDDLTITIAAGIPESTKYRGAWSQNKYPDSGGNGASGVPKVDDYWISDTVITISAVDYPVKSRFTALVNTPGQTAANWDINQG
jgi:hypothetical protein